MCVFIFVVAALLCNTCIHNLFSMLAAISVLSTVIPTLGDT